MPRGRLEDHENGTPGGPAPGSAPGDPLSSDGKLTGRPGAVTFGPRQTG
jgi:hypothetical protein